MEPAPWFYWLIRMLGISLDVDDGISCCPADFASQIGCYKMSWCHVFSLWCVMCYTWLRDREMERRGSWYPGVTQEWRRESLGVCIRLMPVTQWLHAPCLTMISFIVLDLVSGNRKSSVSHWVGLLGWELRVCDQVLMLQMPQVFLHWPALLLLPASEFSLSDSNYQLFSSNAPRSFALKSLVQALS